MLALGTSNQFLEELVASSSYAIFSIDETRRVVKSNNSFSIFLADNDLSEEELVSLISHDTRRVTVKSGIYSVLDYVHDFGRIISFVPIRDASGHFILGEISEKNIVYFQNERLTYLSPAFIDQLGYSTLALKKLEDFVSIVHVSDREKFRTLFQNPTGSAQPAEQVIKIVSKTGVLRLFKIGVNLGHERISEAPYVVLSLDNSVSKDLKFEYDDGFDLLLENTNDFIIVYEDDIIKHISPSFAKLGYNAAEIRSLYDIESLVHPEDIAALREGIIKDRADLRTNSVYLFRIISKRKPLDFYWYETTVKRTFHTDGKIKSLIGFYRDVTEKKIAEDSILASQEYLKKLTNAVTDALYAFDLDSFQYTFYNEAFSQVLGYAPEELNLNRASFLTTIVHPDDRAKVMSVARDLVLRRSGFQELTFRIKTADGIFKTLKTKLYPFTSAGSDKKEVICLTEDMTNELEVQKEITEIKTKYQLAVESSSSGAWEFYPADERFFIDDKVKSLLGYDAQEKIETLKSWEEKIYPDDYRWVTNELRSYLTQKIDHLEIAYRMIHKTGVVRWVLTKGLSTAQEDSHFMGTHTDITELKEYELALSASEENYRDLAESLSDVFLALNKNLVFTYWNKACEKIFKLNAEDVIGKKMYDVLPYFAGSAIEKAVLTSLIRQKVNTTMFKREEGGQVYEVTTYPAKTGVSLFAKNVTHKIKYEKELIDARKTAEEALKTKEEFMSVMSHEIRTPLNAIVGLTHLLLENDPKKEQIETINTLKFSGDNLLVLVNDILDFSKIQAGKIELVDTVFDLHTLAKNLKNTYASQAAQKGVHLTLSLHNNPPRYVLGDKVRLTQILNNLLNNALKFTSKGEVSVIINCLGSSSDLTDLSFTIKDSGIGINKEDQAKIFDPFQQASKTTSRRFGGTGLGLSITKNLVELQNGSVKLISQPGKGSSFEVIIPFKTSSQEIHDQMVSENEIENNYNDLQDIKLLYVDDVATNQFLMKGFCSRWNIQLDQAMNGFEAIDKVKNKQYDCILMDIQMPEIDGYETSKRIREMGSAYYETVPIIAYTAEVSASGKLNVDQAGMNDLLTKPVDPKELFRKINKYSGKTVRENTIKSGMKNDLLTVSFSDLDELYADSAPAYIDFLTQLEREVSQFQQELRVSLMSENIELFNSTKHKMQVSLRAINYTGLLGFLDSVRKVFADQEIASRKEEMVGHLNQYFEYLITKLSSKKEALVYGNEIMLPDNE